MCLLTPNTTRFKAEFLLIFPVSLSMVSICESGYAAHVMLPERYLSMRLFSLRFPYVDINVRSEVILTYLPVNLSLDVHNVEEHLDSGQFCRQRHRRQTLDVLEGQIGTDLVAHVERGLKH